MIRFHHFFCTIFVFLLGVVHIFGQPNKNQTKKGRKKAVSTTAIPAVQPKSTSDSIRFLVPPLDTFELGADFNEPVFGTSADSVVMNQAEESIHLWKKAEVKYQSIQLQAGHIVLDRKKKTLLAEPFDSLGKKIEFPHFVSDDQTMDADKILYQFETKKAKVWNSKAHDGEAYLHAKVAKMENDSTYFAQGMKLTTCNADHPHFYFNIGKAKVMRNNLVVFGPANLVVLGVKTPVGVPFGIFPQKKGNRSGLLPPEPGFSPSQGYFLRNGGFYYGGSPYFNLSLKGDLYTTGSYRLGVSSMYVKRYRYSGNVSVNYSRFRFGDPEGPDFRVQPDFRVTWDHQQDSKANPGTTFGAHVEAGTAGYLRNNSFGSNQFQQNSLNSRVQYSKSFGAFGNLSLSGGHSQNTQTRQFDIFLPEANFNVNRFFPFKQKTQVGEAKWFEQIGVSYNMNLSNQLNTFDSALLQPNVLSDMRSGITHSIPISTSIKMGKGTSKNPLRFFTLSPSLSFNERWNRQAITKSWDGQKVITDTLEGFFTNRDYSFQTSLTTMIYGMYTFGGKLKAIRHVITPSVFYSYRPDFSAASYGYFKSVQTDTAGTTRMYSIFEQSLKGGPSAGRDGSLNFSLGNVVEAKIFSKADTVKHEKKIKVIDYLGVNGGYNFAADSLHWRNFSLNGRTNFSKNFSVQYNANWDVYQRNERGVRIQQFQFQQDGRMARMQNAGFTFSGGFAGKGKEKKSTEGSEEEKQMVERNRFAYLDFSVPYTVNFNYVLRFQEGFQPSQKGTLSQNFVIYGDVALTPKFKLGFNSGYDFTVKKMTSSVFTLYRDLHCWDLSLSVVPFGFNKSYMITFKPKSALLSDLKLTRRREFYDFR